MTALSRLLSPRFTIYTLILLGLLIYFPALSNGFVADDFSQVVTNKNIHSLSNVPQFFTGSTYYNASTETLIGAYYRPLMVSVYASIYAIAGPNPHVFHLIQLLFHIANAILVYFLFRKFFIPLTASILAIIFLIHPQNSEAVVYIANLQDTLFFFFGLLGFLLLTASSQKYFPGLFCLFLSLLAKETGIAFIGMSLLSAALFTPKKLRSMTIGIGILLMLYFILRVPIAQIGAEHTPVAPITLATMTERLLTIPAIIFFYITTFLFPFRISALHFWIVPIANFSQFFFPLGIVLSMMVGLFLWGRHLFLSKNKFAKLFVFICCWSAIGIILHLHLLAVLDATAADRWFYFSFVGLLGLGGVLAHTIHITKPRYKKIALTSLIIIISILSSRTYLRTFDWKDTRALYEHDSNHAPTNFLVNNALGTEYIKDGEYKKAKPLILASVIEYPYFANLNNAAIIALHEENPALARKYLEQALHKSNNYLVAENYSSFLLKYGTKQEALTFTKKAFHQYPQSTKLKKNLIFLQK